jgi:hypothetical protein
VSEHCLASRDDLRRRVRISLRAGETAVANRARHSEPALQPDRNLFAGIVCCSDNNCLCEGSGGLGIFGCVYLHLVLSAWLPTFRRQSGFFRGGGSTRTWNEELSDTACGI